MLTGLTLALAVVGISTGVSVWWAQDEPAEKPASTESALRPVAGTGEYVDAVLDPAKQKQIWNAEHVTFEIEQRFGKAFTAALKARDVDELKRFFLDDCEGVLPVSFKERQLEHAGVSEISRTGNNTVQPVNREAIVQHLVNWLADLSSIEKMGLRVLGIDRTSSLEPSSSKPTSSAAEQRTDSAPVARHDAECWRTTLLLTAAGRDATGRPIENESRHTAVFRIVNEETLVETPSLLSWEVLSETDRAAGRQSLFEEVTEQLGLDRVDLPDNWKLDPAKVSQYRFQLAVDDFNQDGLLDIAAATHRKCLLLMRNSVTEPFRDVTETMGITRDHARLGTPGSLTSSIDVNNDGYPDLVLGTRFYLNDRGRGFLDHTLQSGLTFLPPRGSVRLGEPMGACVADYDGDGFLDLYVVKQGWSQRPTKPRSWVEDHEHGYPNQLWRNTGNGRFVDVTRESGTGGGDRHSLAACWFFYDDDHWPDLYIANDFGRNVLLRNRGDGTFEDVSDASAASDFATTMGVAAGDLNNDSVDELYVANMYSKMGRRIIGQVSADDYPPGLYEQIRGSCAGNRLYWRSSTDEPFTERGSELSVDAVGWAYAPAMIDVDNDGWLDLYATTGFLSFSRGKPDG